MRADEHGWDNYGPAHLAEVCAGIDASGRIIAYQYDGWQHGWVVVQCLDEPSSGAGEEVMGATAAAIANACYDAIGVRLRQYPLTPARVKAALAAPT